MFYGDLKAIFLWVKDRKATKLNPTDQHSKTMKNTVKQNGTKRENHVYSFSCFKPHYKMVEGK